VSATADAQTRKEIKTSLYKAGVIAKIITGDMEISLKEDPADVLTEEPEEYSYVVTFGHISIVSGAPVYYANVAIVPPGKRIFRVQYVRRHETTSGPVLRGNRMVTTVHWSVTKSDIIPVVVDLEPDKFYTFKEDISWEFLRTKGKISVSLQEVTERRTLDKAKKIARDIIANPGDYTAHVVTARDYRNYMDWWKTHPEMLTGSYGAGDGKTQIKFEGNRFQAFSTTAISGRTTFIYGNYWFNDKTIILQTDSMKTISLAAIRSKPGEEVITTDKITEILYYKLKDDTLEILGQAGTLYFPFEGEFQKRPEDAAPSLPPEGEGATVSGMASLDIAWRVENETLIVSGRGDIPGNPAWSSVVDQFTAAEIGDGITGIGHHAFAMSKITSIVIGKDVANLGSYALFNCNDLATVEIKNPVPPKIGYFVFMSTPIGRARLIVLAGSKAAYEKNKDWKKFGTIEER
jgi:hypothetical protein